MFALLHFIYWSSPNLSHFLNLLSQVSVKWKFLRTVNFNKVSSGWRKKMFSLKLNAHILPCKKFTWLNIFERSWDYLDYWERYSNFYWENITVRVPRKIRTQNSPWQEGANPIVSQNIPQKPQIKNVQKNFICRREIIYSRFLFYIFPSSCLWFTDIHLWYFLMYLHWRKWMM